MSDNNRAMSPELARRYWRSNTRVMAVLLCIWAFAGLGCGVLWADWLNQWKLGGVPLGFWFAQQGSIIVFVLIIAAYALIANATDRRYHTLHEDEQTNGGAR